jgi:hypothetical protein
MPYLKAVCDTAGGVGSDGRQTAAVTAAGSGKSLPPLPPCARPREVTASFSTKETSCL